MSCGCVRQAAIAGGVTAAAMQKCCSSGQTPHCLQNCCFYNKTWKSWYQKLQQSLNSKFQLLHTHIRIPKLWTKIPFCPEDAPSCFYSLQGRFSKPALRKFFRIREHLELESTPKDHAGQLVALHRTPRNGRLCPPPQLLCLQFIHFEQQLTAAAVSRSIDVMVPLLQQSKQGTISSHTRECFPQSPGLQSSVSFRSIEMECEVLGGGIDCAPASSLLSWLERWWEQGCCCLRVQSSLQNPSTQSHRRFVCLLSGISEFPLLCFIPQTSTDEYEINTPIFRTVKRPRNCTEFRKERLKEI